MKATACLWVTLMTVRTLPATTFNDANWVSLSAFPGCDGTVFAMITNASSGRLYVAGSFNVVGTAVASSVAQWDGTNWSGLGPGLGGTIRALALDSAGNLYAGGAFANPALGATNVAKWDGSTWTGLNLGFTKGTILGLAVDGSGTLYAGGSFTNASLQATNIARWQGGVWLPTGLGMNGNVFALALDASDNLYAGGDFTLADGTSAPHVAEWNGSGWSSVGGGMNGRVAAMVFDSLGNLYAGGSFTITDFNGGVDRVAVWDGFNWSPVGTGLAGGVLALTVDGSGNLYAGGLFTSAGGAPASHVAVWNGNSNWLALGTGLGNFVYSLAVDSAGNLWAGGSFTSAGGLPVEGLAEWNGITWSAIAAGFNGVVDFVAVDAAGNLYAGGQFTLAGGVLATNVAEWNGTNWSALGGGLGGYPGSYVDALTTDRAGNLYAGGGFTNAGGLMANNIAKWNGTAWSALGSGIAGSASYVQGLALDGLGNLYAGGAFNQAGGVTANGIAKWNGSNAWSALGPGISGGNGYVGCIALDNNSNVYIGGSFTSAGGSPANGIAKWNGNTWTNLGSGMGGVSLNSLAVYRLLLDSNGRLYAVGTFNTAGGLAATNIAAWDGTNWAPIGSGLLAGNGAEGLAFDAAHNLYACGWFTNAGGMAANYIARWDGATWSALGSGLNFPAVSLAADAAGRLYVGGAFTAVGTNVSAGVAQANVLAMISKTTRNPNGNVSMNVLTTPNTANRILAATNLAPPIPWQPIYTNIAPANGAWQFTDTNALHFRTRFYRSSTP